MKTKVLIIVVLMSISAVLMAQQTDKDSKKSFRGHEREMRPNDEPRGPANALNLTDVQKEAFKQSMLTVQKQLQPIRNELGEAKAHQKTLITAEKPDLTAIDKNIEKIGELRIEMDKIQTKHRLEMRTQLTEEQRLRFDKNKDKINHDRGTKGMRHEREM